MFFLKNKAAWTQWVADNPVLTGTCPPESFPCFAFEKVTVKPDPEFADDNLTTFEAEYFDRAKVAQMLNKLRNGK